MPLLYDDFEEVDLGHGSTFLTQEVDQFPEPDSSVKALQQKEAAFQACRALIEAYKLGEDRGYFAWGDVAQASQFAWKALPHRVKEERVPFGS